MRSSYTHVSDCKSELVKKGWIERDGRHRVRLQVGEFAPLKVRDFERPGSLSTSENSELQLRNIPNSARSNFGEFRTSTSEYSESRHTPPAPPIRIEPVIEPVAAAAAATEKKDFRKEPLDQTFVKAIVDGRLYPADLVEFVKNKLVFHCAQEGTEPTKGRLLRWLSIEREPVQPTFFSMKANDENTVVEGKFDLRSPSNPNLLPINPECLSCGGQGLPKGRYCECQICPHCFSTGTEVIDDKAQVCRHKQTPHTQRLSESATG
jgi:hypothetical protein